VTALALMLRQIDHGWAVTLSDGREVVRFTGLGAKRRAIRWLRMAVQPDAAPHGRQRSPRLLSLIRAVPTGRVGA
jgi:hypothetical protein